MTDQEVKLRAKRAEAVAKYGSVWAAVEAGQIPERVDLSLAEVLILGLLNQDVRSFVGIFGHGSTHLGEVLRVYAQAGACRVFPVRHETEAAHAASALRWVTGEKAAVFTSIGPGALQAFAGALASASNGLGVWHLYGDETTEDEGPNMQQVPKSEQGLFHRLFSTMSDAYSLHTPGAVSTALRRGQNCVDHPWQQRPFFLLMPMNTQPSILPMFNLAELPRAATVGPALRADHGRIQQAIAALSSAKRIVVKVGGGGRFAGEALSRFVERVGAVVVHTPGATGVIPSSHPANMGVGGSKGSICGNFAMEEADLLVAIGTRAVCQSDSSRTGYPKVQTVISINPDPDAANHYGRNIPLIGTAQAVLEQLCQSLTDTNGSDGAGTEAQGTATEEARGTEARCLPWRHLCTQKRAEWEEFKALRFNTPTLHDDVWGRCVLTQPAAIKTALDWAKGRSAPVFFDAGDVQANGFQIAQDQRPGQTFTDTGASYMGFAVSALLASAISSRPFYGVALTGDGSFTMNPQILIDGAVHKAKGCIVLFDNRRMAAISGLQQAQYGHEFATWDHHPVDYVAWANSVQGVLGLHGGHDVTSLLAALERAAAHDGLSLVHVPVYCGPDPLGGLGAFGRWNVGNWVDATQALRHDIGL